MAQLFAEDDICGRILINLTSRGNAIIAELLRLKDYVPEIFQLNNKVDQQKYGEIITDFWYFKTSNEFEKRIEDCSRLQELDAEIRETYTDILHRFFLTFESIHKYAIDLNQFIEDLNDGIYLQQTLESLFLNDEAKQLLCETLYLYGVMLLVLDVHIEGSVRERLLVSYYRYCAQRYFGSSTIDDVCKLIRSTGYESNKIPAEYPRDYFRRISISEDLVHSVIGHLRTDDIYNQISAYPDADHRSTALSSQAAMFFVCLFFDCSILQQQSAKMREITDKFFADNWVVNVYMGLTANVIDLWDSFKAARLALANTLDMDNVRSVARGHYVKLKKYVKQTHELLKEGVLVEDKIYDNIGKLVKLCRDCNVTLRWLFLHTIPRHSVREVNKRCKQVREQIMFEIKVSNEELLHLLLNISQFEQNLKELVKKILDKKEISWNDWKSESYQRMRELSDAFTGEKPLTKIAKNENLRVWFADVANQIESLNVEKSESSSRKILQLLRALENVQGFHGLSSHHQVNEYIRECSSCLHKMDRLSNIKEDILVDLQIICDFSYAWNAIDNYTPLMQDLVKTDPSCVIKLRALFLKLSSALETPLIRINQAGSADLVSVSEYYSHELVAYIRKVLHIIPETIFSLMNQIVHFQTNIIHEIPMRLDKDKIKEHAQFNDRMQVARLTHAVSLLSEGILGMKNTLVGIVKIDPKKLLEEGIRRELVKHISYAFHDNIRFDSKSKDGCNNLTSVLLQLNSIMDGYRRSFEYIQDYVGIYGLKIWHEELSRIIAYNVEIECGRFLKSKIRTRNSVHQNKIIPIPDFLQGNFLRSGDGGGGNRRLHHQNSSLTFIGQLLAELIRLTDPKTTVYVPNSMAWFDHRTNERVLNFKIFVELRNSIGISGMAGLDKLLAFMIVTNLQSLNGILRSEIMKDKAWNDYFVEASSIFTTDSKIIENSPKVYGQYINRFHKLPSTFTSSLLSIGQLQILRQHLRYQLRLSCKFESEKLYSCVETINDSVIAETKTKCVDKFESFPSLNNQLLSELCAYFDRSGIADPLEKLYVTSSPFNVDYLALFMAHFAILQFSKLRWNSNTATLQWKKIGGDPMDGVSLNVGIHTFFHQFHPDVELKFLLHLNQFWISQLNYAVSYPEKSEAYAELETILHFFEAFLKQPAKFKHRISRIIPEEAVHLLPILDSSCLSPLS